MYIGYARVSTLDQTLDLQKDALTKAGCKEICTDRISGAISERPGLTKALQMLREGDVLVVWKLDRLGRTLKQLIELVTDLQQKGIGFKSLTENIDTTSPGGKLIFHIFASLAEFERDLIRERTLAGLAAARTRGKKGGRPRALSEREIAMARSLLADKQNTIDDICKTLRISRPTLYRYGVKQ